MVKLIPDRITQEIKSNAERRLFLEFRSHRSQDTYIVLHSLGLAEHLNNVFGEIDFVVICSEGILCLEVKGGVVSRDAGIWTFTNRYGETTRKNTGPFQQTQGNMYSLRNYLKKRLGEDDNLIRCQFACAVLMPDCSFYASDPEVIDDILFDRKSNWTLDTIRDKSFDYWRRTCREKHQFEGKRLSEDEIERLGKLLRGDFGSVPALRSEIDSVSNEIYALTKEQYEVLEALSDNPRILVSGAAGTGKTLLAVEQAKRAFWEGRSVLFLCYNRSVAQFVSALFIREQVNIPAITLHALMMRECGIKWSDELDHSWFSQILPDMFLKRENITSFDTVIVDEGQDLLNNVYIQCIDRLVSGGIRTGVWTVYYDSNQNLFSTWHMLKDTLDYLKCKTSVASYRLRVNCRNTKQIADANTLISNFSDRGRAIINGPQTKFIAYNDKHHEYELLSHIICELIQFGVMGSDITILSKYSLSNPLNTDQTERAGYRRGKEYADDPDRGPFPVPCGFSCVSDQSGADRAVDRCCRCTGRCFPSVLCPGQI